MNRSPKLPHRRRSKTDLQSQVLLDTSSSWEWHFCSTFSLDVQLIWTKPAHHLWCIKSISCLPISWNFIFAPSAGLSCGYVLISFLWTIMIPCGLSRSSSKRDLTFLYLMLAGCSIRCVVISCGPPSVFINLVNQYQASFIFFCATSLNTARK